MAGKTVNIQGQRFERWLVLERAASDKYGNAYWKCRCDCGNTKIVSGTNLRRGITKSCGCLMREKTSDANRLDLHKQRFGRLIVLKYVYTLGSFAHWECICDCGSKIMVCSNNLRTGHTKSCGCIKREMLIKRNYIDGRCSDVEYQRKWERENRDKCRASSAKRRSRKRDQTPTSANFDLILQYYTAAVAMEDFQVDHIKPLSKGGMHHQDNLQLLPRHLNQLKSNKWPLTEEDKIKYKGIRL